MTTRNPETTVERRTELLKLEGDGFPKSFIVKTLSTKYECCPHTIYRDYRVRDQWQPKLSNLSDKKQAFHSVLNCYQQIYRKASFLQLQAKNESINVAALKVMSEQVTKIATLTGVTPEQVIGVIGPTPIVCKAWQPKEDSTNEPTE